MGNDYPIDYLRFILHKGWWKYYFWATGCKKGVNCITQKKQEKQSAYEGLISSECQSGKSDIHFTLHTHSCEYSQVLYELCSPSWEFVSTLGASEYRWWHHVLSFCLSGKFKFPWWKSFAAIAWYHVLKGWELKQWHIKSPVFLLLKFLQACLATCYD